MHRVGGEHGSGRRHELLAQTSFWSPAVFQQTVHEPATVLESGNPRTGENTSLQSTMNLTERWIQYTWVTPTGEEATERSVCSVRCRGERARWELLGTQGDALTFGLTQLLCCVNALSWGQKSELLFETLAPTAFHSYLASPSGAPLLEWVLATVVDCGPQGELTVNQIAFSPASVS